MDWKKTTTYFIIGAIAIIALYDVLAFSNGGTESTISFVMYEWSYKYPVFTFAMGFVMGHLFWQMKMTKKIKALEARIKELEEENKKLGGA